MSAINYPSWWKGASFVVRAGWLKSSGHARTYEEACSMLARKKRPAPVVPILDTKARAKMWWLKES